VLDRGLVLYFPGPASFTGEDCAEFHVHGGRAVVDALLKALVSHTGVRLAEAGEFARRAFANGKMTLLDSEALADLIAADTEAERRFAVSNGTGRHAELYSGWRASIIGIRARIEANLDFGDEDDVPDDLPETVWTEISALEDAIRAHAAGYERTEMMREGFDVVLLGAPNVGKSSLINALAAREVAIVTEEPGTTRDLLDVLLDVGGIKVRITDTAGLRRPEGRVEEIGIERALARSRTAQLVLLLAPADGSVPFAEPPASGNSSAAPQILRVATKSDLAPSAARSDADHVISTVSGEGLAGLVETIGRRAAETAPAPGEILPWKARHVGLLCGAVDGLAQARAPGLGLEIRAEFLRAASRSLGRIAGDVDVEDLLDSIFGTFCIGK
jgi:tRNA modification GTPase